MKDPKPDDLWFLTPCQGCETGSIMNCLNGEAWLRKPRRVVIITISPCRTCGWKPDDIDDPI